MRAAEFDNPGIDACRPPAGYLRRNGVGQHHPQAFLDLMQYAADLCAEDEAVASQRCRHQVRRLLRKAGKLLEFPAHLRIGTIAAGGEDDAPACSDRFARTHYDAGHSAVFDRKASDALIGEHRHAAGTQHLEEMADQAQPLDAHVLPSALTDEVLVPARKAVDAAPGDLLFGDHETGHVIGRWEACAPVVEIALRDQVDLKRLPDRVGAWRLAVITVGQAADDAK